MTTTPDKAGEPSMEEILASIRKIIAEEPQSTQTPDRRAVNPLLTGNDRRSERSDAPLPFGERPPPSLDRLSSALRSTVPASQSATEPRTPSFDDELADLLDEPAGALPAAPAALSLPTTEGSDETGFAREAKLRAAGLEQSAPPAQPSPPRVSGFPPLRRAGGFYPPRKSTEEAPATRTGLDTAEAPASLTGFGNRADGTGPSEGAASDRFEAVAPPFAAPGSEPASTSVSAASDDEPRKSETASASSTRSTRTESPAFAELTGSAPAERAPQRASGTPVQPPPPQAAAQTRWPSQTGGTTVANGRAASAEASTTGSPLDALVQNLAASPPEAGRAPAAGQPQTSPPATATSDGSRQPVRTLEDAVTDLLKPMLQQWLADNMPRIIERALRVEAARSVPQPPTPPGKG